MSDEEKTHAQLIEDIIARKMMPLYFIHGGMALTVITIFVAIAWPVSDKVSTLSVDVSKCVTSEEAYKNFLPKGTYHLLQKDEHESDLEAIRNPEDADFIYMKNNNAEAERLDLASRGTSRKKYFKDEYDKAKNETN